ncbi:hypothetical protein NAEGRDRAFT_59338 [Naegleria gruberi]|uniref:Zn(2)-C6 fungal-type domain-containing protein n=1 Tax=Naegleria gruberi TaxID=5762 RepID=D2VVJ1_NAEGR|nr:uncharacterized protein NAEGRDRAFT_59338 [Naegleria gruberi]EFC39043.1 hypothetical protein NAEGRDRAFT_59338 [Naegleria gruberi]|eukprot:XP_002671787.1 hypothetical protein NAEGRDRAFT_59338 [Naegleria gruberi strain NEG-M]
MRNQQQASNCYSSENHGSNNISCVGVGGDNIGFATPSSAMSAQSTLQQLLLNTVAAQQQKNPFLMNSSSMGICSSTPLSTSSVSSSNNNNTNATNVGSANGNCANLFSNLLDSTTTNITKNIPMNNNSNTITSQNTDNNISSSTTTSFYNPTTVNNNNLNSLLNNPNFTLNSLLLQQLQQSNVDILNSSNNNNNNTSYLASSPPSSNSFQFINQQTSFNNQINSSDLGFLSTSTSSNSSSSNSNLTPSPTNLSLRHSPPFSSPNNVNSINNNNMNNNNNILNENQNNTINATTSSITLNHPTSTSTTTTNNNTPSKASKKNLTTSSTSFNPYPVTTKSTNENSSNGKQLMFIEENGKSRVSSSLLQSNSDQFEISCTSCRAKHRKCSKELPACSYCLARGITCIYRKPKKKGRQGKQQVGDLSQQPFDLQSNTFLDMQSSFEMNPQIVNNFNEPNNMFTMMGNQTIPSTLDNNFIPFHQQNQQELLQQHEFQNASSIESFDPNNWINQIRSSLQTNDNSNDINMLHSLLTSDSINNIFSLTNLMENNPLQNQSTTNSTTNQQQQQQHNYSINDLTDELMKRLTLEDYCKSTSFPVIDKSEFSSLLHSEKRTLEATALLYSIHALMCQRKGLKHEAASACNQARNILSRVFDKNNDFLIACAYCNLSVYSSGEGNLAEAKFYLKFVDYYFENESTSETNNVVHVNNFNLKMLKTVAEMSAGIAAQDVDSNPLGIDSEKKEIGNLLIGFYKLCTGEKKAPQPLLDIVSKTVTGDTLKLYMTLLELVSKLFYQHEMERNLSNEHSEISQRVINSFIHGTRVLILQECGISSGSIIEESANRLINISCEDNYGTAYSVLLCAIAAACRVHLKIVRDIKKGIRMNNGEDGVDYFEMIKKGLKALTLFSTRYGRVTKLYRSLIIELQEVEREHSGFKLCLLATKEIERLKLKKLSPTMDVPSLLSKDDILSIYYLVSPEQ